MGKSSEENLKILLNLYLFCFLKHTFEDFLAKSTKLLAQKYEEGTFHNSTAIWRSLKIYNWNPDVFNFISRCWDLVIWFSKFQAPFLLLSSEQLSTSKTKLFFSFRFLWQVKKRKEKKPFCLLSLQVKWFSWRWKSCLFFHQHFTTFKKCLGIFDYIHVQGPPHSTMSNLSKPKIP